MPPAIALARHASGPCCAAAFALLTCAGAPARTFAQSPFFTVLPGARPASCGGISGDGATVVGTASNGAPIAGRWVNGGPFLAAGPSNSIAFGASADGNTWVAWSSGQVLRWRPSGIDYIGPPSGYGLQAVDMAVAGDAETLVLNPDIALHFYAFRWTSSGGWAELRYPSWAIYSSAMATSYSATVTVGSIGSSAISHAVRWLGTAPAEDLGAPASFDQSVALGVSADGRVIVGAAWSQGSSSKMPFVWSENSGFTMIPNLPGATAGWAQGVSQDGSVVVGFCSRESPYLYRFFVWTRADGTRDLFQVLARYGLNVAGISQSGRVFVSYDGREFAGNGGSGGYAVAWYARLPPGALCYANCDRSTMPPYLSISDLSCFLNAFSSGDSYANCDNSTDPPVLNVNDFICFLNRFAAGCP